jgi:hemerythrin-like metal-binding protein
MLGYQWEEKYSVGVQSIDNQHKEIFRLLDKLFEALKSGQAVQTTIRIITELENYAVMHFHKEEFFFRQFNYNESGEHLQEHKQFIEKVAAIKADAKSGKLASSFELINFLKNWIDHHILEMDMKYRECFHKNGLR